MSRKEEDRAICMERMHEYRKETKREKWVNLIIMVKKKKKKQLMPAQPKKTINASSAPSTKRHYIVMSHLILSPFHYSSILSLHFLSFLTLFLKLTLEN